MDYKLFQQNKNTLLKKQNKKKLVLSPDKLTERANE